MKLSCYKMDLNYAVQVVHKAISIRGNMPILTGIYLSAQDDKLTLQATDYELGISCTIDADVETSGEIVLSGKYFQELVKKLPGDTVNISQSQGDNTVEISSNKSKFNLLNMSAEEFPEMLKLHAKAYEVNSIKVKDNILKELIKKTVFACANDESNPIYTGVLFENTLEDIRMAATNTHRLAVKKLSQNDNDKLSRLIIPSKALNELARLLVSDVPAEVEIFWDKNKIAFIFDNIYFEIRLIEGKYPEYSKIIPESFRTISILETVAFYNAVERVALIAKEGDYNNIKFTFGKDIVNLTSNTPGIGKAFESIPIKIDGDEIELTFNAKYILDILKNITSQNIIFSLNTPLSAASIRPEDDEEYIYIITPVRTSA